MAEIYLVRHGQASLGSDNYDQLSELGHKQARWLGDYFKLHNMEFDHLYRGDMVRHDETMAGMGAGLDLDTSATVVTPDLNEFDFHALIAAYITQYPDKALAKGASTREYYHLLKMAMKEWAADKIVGELPETWENFNNRVNRAFQEIQNNCSGKVLIASSGGVIAMFVASLLKAPAESVVELNLQTRNTGVSHFFFNQHAIRLTSFNNTPHLDAPDMRQHITFS